MEKETNYFVQLNAINVSDKIEKKNGLSYLSWAYAWEQAKLIDCSVQQKVYETPEGLNYWHDTRTAWVKVGVTLKGIEHIEYLPVMDYKNKSIPVKDITSMNVNTSIQRAATKAIARHGIGLYIYAGEDLPEEDKKAPNGALSVNDTGLKKKKGIEINARINKLLDEAQSLEDLKIIWVENTQDLNRLKIAGIEYYEPLEKRKNELKAAFEVYTKEGDL